jgi:aryl-alcohol dehydrogenase-like predicted oxidoreductase
MKELIKEGKIKHWGLSATDVDTIKRAHVVCAVSAVESEYSIMYRKIETDVLPVCEELGIAIVPFSPLAKGFLSGTIGKNTKYQKGDLRNIMARFKPDAIDANQELLSFIEKIAEEKHVTPAQISLAWVMARNPHVVPIPGTRNVERLKENTGAADIELSKEEYDNINALLYKIDFMEVNF